MSNNNLLPILEVESNVPPVKVGLCNLNIQGYSLDDFQTFDPKGYNVLCNLGESCEVLNYYPPTSKIILNVRQTSEISYNLNNLVPNLAKDLAISEEEAVNTAIDFFSDKKVVIQPLGFQGKVYHIMQSLQNYYPIMYTTKAVSAIKTTGLTGITIITKAPLTFVGATYIGSIFCGYCGGVAGNNTVGLIFNTASYVLSCPMRVVEVITNGILLKPLSNLIGVPLILNGTQEILSGGGISPQEYSQIAFAFERLINSGPVKKIRKIYKIIRQKD